MDEKLQKVLFDNDMEKYITLLDQKDINTISKFKKLTASDIIILGVDTNDRDNFVRIIDCIPNEEYIISGKLTLSESRHFTYSLFFPRFLLFLEVFLLLVVIIMFVIDIMENNPIFFPFIIIFLAFFVHLLFGSIRHCPKCIFTEDKIKMFSDGNTVQMEYEKRDIKKILIRGDYVLVKTRKVPLPIVERFFDNRSKYNEFVYFLNSNYKELIMEK